MKNLAFWIAATAVISGIASVSGKGDEGPMPDLDGALAWLNSSPLSSKALRGKVVVVNFWTYSCINSLRELPYMKAWAAKYKDAGLVVIGIHAPEFGFEKDLGNVKTAVSDLRVTYPNLIDSNHSVWSAFHNQYWPADYFIDAKGRIRYHHFGEGEYDKSERVIQTLLRENGANGFDEGTVRITGEGAEARALHRKRGYQPPISTWRLRDLEVHCPGPEVGMEVKSIRVWYVGRRDSPRVQTSAGRYRGRRALVFQRFRQHGSGFAAEETRHSQAYRHGAHRTHLCGGDRSFCC